MLVNKSVETIVTFFRPVGAEGAPQVIVGQLDHTNKDGNALSRKYADLVLTGRMRIKFDLIHGAPKVCTAHFSLKARCTWSASGFIRYDSTVRSLVGMNTSTGMPGSRCAVASLFSSGAGIAMRTRK